MGGFVNKYGPLVPKIVDLGKSIVVGTIPQDVEAILQESGKVRRRVILNAAKNLGGPYASPGTPTRSFAALRMTAAAIRMTVVALRMTVLPDRFPKCHLSILLGLSPRGCR
jgi:hypothetical protein